MMNANARPRHLLVTGLPHAVAELVLQRILGAEPATTATLIVRGDGIDAVETMLRAWGPLGARCRLLLGDVTAHALGLSDDERLEEVARTTDIFHFASVYHLGFDKLHLEDVNLHGTRQLLLFARGCAKLRCIHHYSTAFVAGSRSGVVLEEELERGQSFRNTFERTKFTAELDVRRAMHDLPITVYRPGLVLGHARTGELGRVDGPYFLVQLLSNAPERLAPPASSAARFPFHAVPIDFVADAIAALSGDDAAIGRTLHLTDPNAIAIDDAFRLISECAEQRVVRRTRGDRVAGIMRRLPYGEELVNASRIHLDELDTEAFFVTRRSGELLRKHGILCPYFPDYVDRLVAYAQRRHDGWESADAPRANHSSRAFKALTGRFGRDS